MSLQLGQHVKVKSPRSPRRQQTATETPVFTIDPHVEKKISPLVAKLRDLALRRGEGAFRDVGTLLGVGRAAQVAKGRRPSAYNPNEIVKLNPDAFKLTIAAFGIVLTTADVNMLLLAFRDTVGYLVVTHFLQHLKNTLNAVRMAVVREAFESLPRDAEGLVSIADMASHYHPDAHPYVISGQTRAANVVQQFMDAFDGTTTAVVMNAAAPSSSSSSTSSTAASALPSVMGTASVQKSPNGLVSLEEFVAYYAGVSYGLPDDGNFILMVRNLWDLFDKLPPPPVERCFIPSPNSPTAERWTTATTTSCGGLGGDVASNAPRTIVGYTGHVPGAVEHYGESFAATQKHLAGYSIGGGGKERYVPQPGEHIDEPLKLKVTNKANKHNHTFA